MEEKIEPYYQNEAKNVVDMLFDAGLFKEEVTRDHMKAIEDYMAYVFQSNAKSVRRAVELLAKLPKSLLGV